MIDQNFLRRDDFTHPLVSHLLVYLLLTGKQTTSLNKLAAATGLSVQTVRTALRQLQENGDVSCETTCRGTIITMPETPTWEEYLLKSRNNTSLSRKQIFNAYKLGTPLNKLIKQYA